MICNIIHKMRYMAQYNITCEHLRIPQHFTIFKLTFPHFVFFIQTFTVCVTVRTYDLPSGVTYLVQIING